MTFRSDRTTSGSVLHDLYGSLTKVVGGLWTRYGGWGWSRIRMFLPSARFDWEREAGDVWRNSIVALAIAWLGNRFPRPRMEVRKIARNGEETPLGRHKLTDLWNRPNPYYGRRTLEKAIGLSLIVDGNAYLYKVRNRLGEVIELWWIPHFRILPTWPPDGSEYIDGYRVWLDNAVYHLPPADVLHIRDGIDPRNERLGLSAVASSLREVCTVNYESSYAAALLKNSGVPGIVIVPDTASPAAARPSPDAADRMKERFREALAGDNAGDAVVLKGAYKITTLGFTPEQMALDKLPRGAQARVAASTGVALMSLGLADDNKTYSNLAEANRTSWGTIVAMQELVAEHIRWDLLPEFGADPHSFTVGYDYSEIQELQESLDSLHERTREDFKADLLTRNESRELIGFEPDSVNGDLYFSEVQAGAGPEPEPLDVTPTESDAPQLPSAESNGKALAIQDQRRWTY